MTLPLIPSDKKEAVQQNESAAPLICMMLGLCLSLIAFGSNSTPTAQSWGKVGLVVLFAGQLAWIGYLYFKKNRSSRHKKA